MKKLIITLSALIIIGLLGFGAYKVFLAAKVPQAFIDSHNKIADLQEEIEKLTDPEKAPDFEKLMEDKDYNGAAKATNDTLANENQALAKSKAIDGELATLRSLSDKITDAKVKDVVAKRISLGEKENAAKIKYITIRIQALEKMKETIVLVNKDEKLFTAADEKAADALLKQVTEIIDQGDKVKSELDALQGQYKAVEKEFMETAGLSVQ